MWTSLNLCNLGGESFKLPLCYWLFILELNQVSYFLFVVSHTKELVCVKICVFPVVLVDVLNKILSTLFDGDVHKFMICAPETILS